MTATLALRMFAADFLKLRKKLSTVVWASILALGPLVILFVVKAIQHSQTPPASSPAGGISGMHDAVRLLALFFGPLAAILIGVDSGAGDVAAGVFRDLVATGRSRFALFFSRVPAALAMCWLVMIAGLAITFIATYALAAGSATPGGGEVIENILFTLLATGVVCVVAVGFASLTGSRPAALTVLIGWQLIASRILENIESLGGSRKLILSQAIDHFAPFSVNTGGGHGPHSVVTMSTAVAIVVMAAWIAVFLALGAWHTNSADT